MAKAKARKPIKVFYSQLSGRFYASNQYRHDKNGFYVITGPKDDVTNDIGRAVTHYDIAFSAVEATIASPVEEQRQ